MPEEIDGLMLAVGAVSLLIIILLVQSTRRFESDAKKGMREADAKVAHVEKSVLEVKDGVQKLRKELDDKIDYNYLDKRIDGLVALVKR